MGAMLFDGWGPIVHVLLVGPLAYVAMVALLRVSGKRTLSKMNAFDFVVTIALGSMLATTIMDPKTSLATGATAFAVIIGLQFVVTFLAVRSRTVERIVKAQPTLLYHRGEFCTDAMREMRVTREEVVDSVRQQGISDVGEVRAVVLETDGSISVLA